jgi:hypothetical protein
VNVVGNVGVVVAWSVTRRTGIRLSLRGGVGTDDELY